MSWTTCACVPTSPCSSSPPHQAWRWSAGLAHVPRPLVSKTTAFDTARLCSMQGGSPRRPRQSVRGPNARTGTRGCCGGGRWCRADRFAPPRSVSSARAVWDIGRRNGRWRSARTGMGHEPAAHGQLARAGVGAPAVGTRRVSSASHCVTNTSWRVTVLVGPGLIIKKRPSRPRS